MTHTPTTPTPPAEAPDAPWLRQPEPAQVVRFWTREALRVLAEDAPQCAG